MKNSRGFIQIILILIVLAVIAGGAYYFGTKNKSIPTPIASVQPSSNPVATSNPTANWKTYTNKTFNYQFRCPQTSKHTLNTQSPVYGLPYLMEGCDEMSNQFRIEVTRYFNTNAFTQQGTLDELNGASLSLQNWRETSLGGNKMVLYQTVNPFVHQVEADVAEIRLDNERKIYIRGFNKTYFDQILSTFQFTK